MATIFKPENFSCHIEDFSLDMGLKDSKILKNRIGDYIWCPEYLDFEPMTFIGEKGPTKRMSWEANVEANDENFYCTFNYKTARLIMMLQDIIEYQDRKLKLYDGGKNGG